MKKNAENIVLFFYSIIIAISFLSAALSLIYFSHRIILSTLDGEIDVNSFVGMVSVLLLTIFVYISFQIATLKEPIKKYIRFIDFLEEDLKMQQKNRYESNEVNEEVLNSMFKPYSEMSVLELKDLLDKALKEDDYETAIMLRDVIKDKTKN